MANGDEERGKQGVPRSRSGMLGRRFPRTGDEPITAQSALGLRLLLSLIFVPVFLFLTIVFLVWWLTSDAGDTPSPEDLRVLTIIGAAVTALAGIDLAVIVRRLRRERGSGGGGGGGGGVSRR
ncbi:hypothetical protein [Streptomyces sp. YIM 98790]|uniref:hypothetical protein n=1 Tax=Streptomyces sp. YIM 98790 TaxID=2689077 RepID=UPI0028BEB0A3|nr:hypothetical protein [Streptomyces sp. YIM 98790]